MDWKTRISALFFWIFIVLSSIGNGNAEKRVVCYYTNWSVYRPGTAKFSPQNINPYLCTHLIYAFGGFTKENTLKPFDKYQDIEKGGYAKFTGLKTYNKDLKTMLAIGGWNEGSSRFSPMVADPGRRKEFVKNSVKFLRQNHFDGLDLDWEYPAFRDGGKPRDRNNYADLVQELREEFERESSKTGRPRLLLSMAVPAGIEYIDKGYDVPRLNEYLDFINLLSYDYHSAYEPAANHHAPLFPLEEDNEYNYDTELTIDYTITHLLKSGASSEKIVLGIPTYGRSYTLFNEEATDIGAPADGPGEEGDATREKGYLAYYEICESIAKSDEWQVVQPNPSAMGPYAFRGNQWVGYDDEDIVRAKARYVNEKKLGGIMFWSIDNDDFRGKCHGRPYPLIEAAKETMLLGNEKSNSGSKTRVQESRKKSRPQGSPRPQVNSISRKFKTGRRSTTTEIPAARRRISTSRSNGRSNGRARGNEDIEDNEEDDEEEVNSVKSVEKPKPRTRAKNTRLRNQSVGGGRKKQQQNSRNNEEKKTEEEPEEETRGNKLTTPEPPTTPDPGSDFKCEDEGFFPHPRDCKKYFWCLDSGPSGLGIVGHQFTCPSGLVFNKAADSCDYPRNVVCPKTKTTQNTVTSTRAPITAATSRTTYLHKPTQRTTTPETESEEEYEYYDDEEEDAGGSQEIEEEIRSTTTPKTYKTISRNRPTTTTSPPSITTTEPPVSSSTRSYKTTIEKVTSYEDEEDPRVIKELIDLIKKAGGIEQLEKQLLYQDKISGGNTETTEENGKSTPATISRSLYERVLNRQATRIAGGFLGSFSTTQSSKSSKAEQGTLKNSRTGFINGPGGAQFEGLDQVPEVKTLRRTTKHQYVTIDRQRQTTSESPADDDEELDEDDNKDVASSEDRAVSSTSQEKPSNRRFTPSYVNIRRSRPSTTTSENDVDLKDEGEEISAEENEEVDEEEVEEPVTEGRKIVKTEEETPTPKSRYTNVQRFRSTTLRHSVDEVTEKAPLKNEPKTSTTVSTTREKIVPVTEEMSEISTTLPTTPEPLVSSSESLDDEKSETATRQSSLENTLSTSNPETTKIGDDETPRLVENSATEILFTTVPASSIATANNNEDSFTRGPTIAAVSQPRPFGFSRRGRPTTTTTPPTVMTSVTEQARTKVDSETLRLPTLKELVALTTTLSNHVSTSEFTQSPTTNPTIDTTIAINELRDQSEEREADKNRVDSYDLLGGGQNLSDSNNPPLGTTIEKEIFDNDILSSEEIQRRSSSTSVLGTDKELRKIEVPVRILDDTNDEEIAELVLLRIPESKFNSDVLRPVFRVKIIESENNQVHNRPEDTKKITKVETSPESSSENELSDSFRSTPGSRRRKIDSSRPSKDAAASSGRHELPKDSPRRRQRIVKARRRTRPLETLSREDEMKNMQNDQSANFPNQVVRRITRRRKNSEKSSPDTTTPIPEVLEQLTNTIRPTTLRGNHSLLSRAQNVTRGFYITKDIDETSTTSDSITTEYQNHLFDDTTQDIDLMTQEIEFTTQTIASTTPEIEVSTQIDETMTPLEQSGSTTESGSITDQQTTLQLQSSTEQPTTSFETVTPDDISTIVDEMTESASLTVPTTEAQTIKEPEITTFRPQTTERATTLDPTVSSESMTTEYPLSSSTEIKSNVTVSRSEETTEDVAESLKTSENTYWRSSTIVQPNTTNGQSKTSSMQYDEHFKAQRQSIAVENTTGISRMTSDQNGVSVTTKLGRFEVETTTIPMRSTFDQFNGKIKPEAESSSQATTNHNARATTYHAASNRGGVRYTTASKSSTLADRSLNKSTNENLASLTNTITTKAYDVTGQNVRDHKAIDADANSLQPSSTTPSRRRGNVRKTTRPSKATETRSSPSNPREPLSTDPTVTKDYENNIRTSVNDRSTYFTHSYDQDTVNHAQNPRTSSRGRHNSLKTTKSFENAKSKSHVPTQSFANSESTIEPGGEAVESTTRDESSYATINFKKEAKNNLETSIPFAEVSTEPQMTSESLDSHTNIIDTSNPHGSHVTVPGVTEPFGETTPNKEISSTSTTTENSATTSSVSSDARSTMSFEDQQTTMKPSALDDLSSTVNSEFNEQSSESTTLSVPTIYLTTNFVESTRNGDSSPQTSGPETTRFFISEDPNNNSISTEETLEDESSTLMMDFSTASKNTNDLFDETTTTMNSRDASLTFEDTTSQGKDTTYEGASIPWLYVPENENNYKRQTKVPIDTNDPTTDNTLEILTSTSASYASDPDKFVTNSADDQTKITIGIVPDSEEGTTEGISKSIISKEDKKDVTTESNNLTTVSVGGISEKSIDTTTKIDTTIEQINLREKESVSQNDVIPSRATSTTPIYEKSSDPTLRTTLTSQMPIIEPQIKRPRGRVRFTNFAGNSDGANGENRRPIKQLVVRRRLAKDRQRNATTTESNVIKSEISLNDKNQKTRFAKIKNVAVKNEDVEKQNEENIKLDGQQINEETPKKDDAKIQNQLNDRRFDEKTNSSKATRRRVVVYRGRSRSENIATTARPVTTTTVATTSVESSNASSGEKTDDKQRRRRKWRKRIVLKRSRPSVEEDDQSIAETGVFRRTFIDGQYVEDAPDEVTGSYIVMPDVVETFSEPEDGAVEVNPFKSSGAFLRRPGTLVRNDALNRLRSKVGKTSVPTDVSVPTIVPFAKIQSADPTYEMKTEDQSVKAQELAVTLSDPPAPDALSTTGRSGLRKQATARKISTTVAPRTESTSAPKTTLTVRRRLNRPRHNNNLRTLEAPVRPRRPAIIDYDYYVDDEIRLVLKPELKDKLFLTKKGSIRCLDQGNFAHPTSCKKFITCARMVNGQVIGTEYTCPDKLSFDPVGGICNWSAGLGCEEKSKTST